jgi:hypothetical protein
MHSEIVQRFEEAPVVAAFIAASRAHRPEHLQRDIRVTQRYLDVNENMLRSALELVG